MAEKKLVVSAYGLSATGKGQNLDNMFLNGRYINVPTETSSRISKTVDASCQIFAVSDSEIGIGEDRRVGTATGSIVMDMLTGSLNEMARNNGTINRDAIWDDIVAANRNTKEIRSELGTDMLGTSFAALYLHGNRGLAVHLGDSRIYVIRGGRTLQITEDHLESSDMFRLGILSQAQAEVHKSSSRLTAYVGMDGIYDSHDEAFSKYFIFYPGDVFILCTDGITDAVLNDKMERITRLLKDATPDQIAHTLMDAASEHSTEDRTVIVLRIEETDGETASRPAQREAARLAAPREAALRGAAAQSETNQPTQNRAALQAAAETPSAVPADMAPTVPVQTAPAQPQTVQAVSPSAASQPALSQPFAKVKALFKTTDSEETAVGDQNPTEASFRRDPVYPQTLSHQQLSPVNEPEEEEDGFLDVLLAHPKRLALIVGVGATAIILLIVIIAAIAKGGKKTKSTAESSTVESSVIVAESSTVESSVIAAESSTESTAESSDASESSEESSTTGVTEEFEYTVQSGDTLYDIVYNNYGTADVNVMEALATYNGISVDDGLSLEQVLKIPPLDKLGITLEESDE